MTSSINAKRRASELRRAAILKAAASVFFEQGYAATSIDAIIERVGGSKRNIYNEFGSKEGLFTALVSEAAEEALEALAVENIGSRDLDGSLREFGRRLLGIYMSSTLIGVLRTVMAEASRFPELAKAFYEKGPGRTSDRLTAVLEVARARGEIDVPDCRMAAEHFVGMLRDNLHLRVLLGLQDPPEAKDAEAIVASVVSIFLKGVRADRIVSEMH